MNECDLEIVWRVFVNLTIREISENVSSLLFTRLELMCDRPLHETLTDFSPLFKLTKLSPTIEETDSLK